MRHNLTFTQEGTINLTISYQSWVESTYGSKDTDILQISAYGYPHSEEERLEVLEEDIRRIRAYGQSDCDEKTSELPAGATSIPEDPTARAGMERDIRRERRELEQERQNMIRNSKSRAYQSILDKIHATGRVYRVMVRPHDVGVFSPRVQEAMRNYNNGTASEEDAAVIEDYFAEMDFQGDALQYVTMHQNADSLLEGTEDNPVARLNRLLAINPRL